MTKNYVNFHILISHNTSCLNRDDMNMQKTAVFGGVKRVRISSQSLKRAIRESDYYANHLGQPSIRTRELGMLRERLHAELGERYSTEIIDKVLALVSGVADLEAKIKKGEKIQASAMAPWSISEFAEYCELVQQENDIDDKKLKKLVDKKIALFNQAMSKNLDIALSGRMATSGLMTCVDGALAMAHAITTHQAEADIDWFTAVDDLIVDEGDVGAAHLGTQEFSSGVFYRYASLNLMQLQKNMGDATREEALDVAAHLLHLLATVVPSAKQQTFAAHNLADFALVSLSDQPISLANAFEQPVKTFKDQGFLNPSIEKLVNYWQNVHQGYGLNDQTKAFSLQPIQLNDKAPSLALENQLTQLAQWLRADANS